MSDLCTINLRLFEEGCIYFCLCLQTVGLVLQPRPFLFCSADRFQYSYPISDWCCCRNEKGWACATNLSFEKVISWQDIGLKTMSDTVQKTPKQRSTQENIVESLQRSQNLHSFRPVVVQTPLFEARH